MNTIDIFKIIVEEIHTTVVATVDGQGLPVTAAIDMMDYDEKGLYFLTARGKNFYNRLKNRSYVALTGVKGQSTMTSLAVSVRGKVAEVEDVLPRLLAKNPYMSEIYPTEQSRAALTAFCLYEGEGEYFDLSQKPIVRKPFVFGGTARKEESTRITENCVLCGKCLHVCPQSCIVFTSGRAEIRRENCLNCGNCFAVCPQNK